MTFDKLFINGNFYNQQKLLQVLGVKDGKVNYIGSELPPNLQHTQIIDLEGKSAYPGFIDAHIHLLSYCWKKTNEVDLSGVNSLSELVSKVKAFINNRRIKPGTWIVGSGWNHERFSNKQLPTRDVLDQISTTCPIVLNRACYHICATNTLALEMANMLKGTSNIEGGSIDIDEKGMATGILREQAVSPIFERIPALVDKSLMKDLIVKGCYDLAEVGITTVHTDDFEFVGDKKALLEAYMELALANELPIKVVLQLRISEVSDILSYSNLNIRSWTDYGNLRIGPIKIIADGSLGSRTAAMLEAYNDEPNNQGILIYEEEMLDQMIGTSIANGFDIAVHAIGDRTMTLILNAYEKYQSIIKEKEFRPSIIHCQIATKSLLDKMAELRVVANIQPVFMTTDWSMVENRVGTERMKYSYCWKTYLEMNIPCAGSSDAPIESFNPLYGIYSGVTRCDFKGNPIGGWIPEEKLTIDESIELFTLGSAFASIEEDIKGSFDIGKCADFVILSDNLQSIQLSHIKKVVVERTYVNGNLIKQD